MAGDYRVIHCAIDELQSELRDLPNGNWQMVFNFYPMPTPTHAIVVCLPQAQPQMAIPSQLLGIRPGR